MLLSIIDKNFDLSLGNMIKELDLKKPFNQSMNMFGFFGRPEPLFLWENKKILFNGNPDLVEQNGKMNGKMKKEESLVKSVLDIE